MQRDSLPVWLMATVLSVCRSYFTVTWKTALLLSGGAQIRGSFLLHQSGQRNGTVFLLSAHESLFSALVTRNKLGCVGVFVCLFF